jgi:protein-tyrosine-phosphatase
MMTHAASDDPSAFLALLDDPQCHRLMTALVLNDIRLHDLAARGGQPPEAVSATLEPLRAAGVIVERRSDANAADLYYHLDLDRLGALYARIGAALPPEFVSALPGAEAARSEARPTRLRVLFLCTHNSVRSQLAETLMRVLSKDQIEAFSAGNQPTNVHPLTIEVLAGLPVDLSRQRSKHLEEFLDQDFDYVITVCDKAREDCPVFPDAKRTIHWSMPDPVAVEGGAAQERAFRQTMNELRNRITYLLIILERERRKQRAVGQAWA